MRPDAELLQMQVLFGQIVEAAHRKGDVVQADLAAGPGGLALARLLFGERAGVDEGDPVMLVVIADEGDELVFVEQLSPEHGAVPLDHLGPAVGLQNQMRQLLR